MSQLTLFSDEKHQSISIEDAAKSISVSGASIRNWIKTGYLTLVEKNMVSVESLESFKLNVAGSDKLTNRANKSLKDSHNHQVISQSFKSLIENKKSNSALLGDEYEGSLSESHRNKEGIYYTPTNIASRFFRNLPDDCSKLTFYDPCCGSGNFLIAALEKGFKPENIFGLDIDPIAVEIAKRRIADLTNTESKNIICGDFLDQSNRELKDGYDVIITNPPWGKKIDKDNRELLSRHLQAGVSKDTSSLFLFACLNKLNKGGLLGLLLQDAFFNIDTFKDARKKALLFKIREFIDFGKPFKGLMTKAKGIILEKGNVPESHQILCENLDNLHYRLHQSFKRNPKLIFNFLCNQNDAEVIEHLFKIEHKFLKGNAIFGLGIVTGNNKKHCSSIAEEGLAPAYKGAEIHKDKLDRPTAYISTNFSQYQQVAPMSLYVAKEKIIYRFISSDLVFFHDTNQSLILNSANMIVIKNTFPITTEQVCALLNSRIINWVFKKLFDTFKVLKADIESLPIHTRFFETHSEFSEESYLKYLGIEEVSIGSFRIKE